MSYTSYEDINSLENDEFVGGTDHYFDFSVVDTNGAAVNLNGATISWKMSHYGYPTSVVSKSLGSGISITGDVTDGNFEVHLLPADTEDLSGKFSHQATITDGTGEKFIPAQGVITITKEIE